MEILFFSSSGKVEVTCPFVVLKKKKKVEINVVGPAGG